MTLCSYSDDRGSIFFPEKILDKKLFKHFVVSKTPPGQERGGHFHRTRTEWFTVVLGKARVTLVDIETKEKEVHILHGENPELIELPPLVALTVESIGSCDMIFLGFFDEVYDQSINDDQDYQI